jgi:hypothetical protein
VPTELLPVGGSSATSPVVPTGVPGGVPIGSPAPGVLGVQPQTQEGNGCGTTSLAMAMTYSTGRPFTQDMVDVEIRLTDIYTSASNMRSFARDNGVEGRLVNNLTDQEVIDNLDKKRPILFLTDLTPQDSGDIAAMHWRVIDGYKWESGKLLLHIADPWGTTYWRSWGELRVEWDDIKAVGLESGYNRFGVVLGANPSDRALGADRLTGVFATEGVIDGSSDVVNDGAQIAHGKIWYFFAALWDGIRTFFSFLLYPFQLLFGGVDHSDGKTATPPQPPPPQPIAHRTTPKVVRELPEGRRKAKGVAWWDGGRALIDNGQRIVDVPKVKPATLDGLQPPATKKLPSSVG